MWSTLNWSRFLLTTSLVQAFTTYNAPGAKENRPHIVRSPQIGKAVLLASLLPLSSARNNTFSAVGYAVTPSQPPPTTHKGTKDDTMFFHPHKGSAAAAARLDQGAVLNLASVLARIVVASLQPQMWPIHWNTSHKWVLGALSVAETASAVSTGGLLSAATAVQVMGAAFLLRCYVLPTIYASLMAVSWAFLCHDGHVRRMLHELYILVPWWFSNKLLIADNNADALIPHMLNALHVDQSTVAIAHDFARASRRYRIGDATTVAHRTGALVMYVHAFGPAVSSSPDWPHVVMHCCCGRILDDFLDMEEDARDGNFNRNFILRLEQQQQQQDAFGGTDHDAVDDADANNNNNMTTPRMRTVVQAMQTMYWHEEQMMDPLVQQYARGATKGLEIMMQFKSRAIKRTWQEARAAAAASSSQQMPPMVGPLPNLVQSKEIAAVGVRNNHHKGL
jgi:hypothetical protein